MKIRKSLNKVNINKLLIECDTTILYRRVFYKYMPVEEAVRRYMKAWEIWLTDEEL